MSNDRLLVFLAHKTTSVDNCGLGWSTD